MQYGKAVLGILSVFCILLVLSVPAEAEDPDNLEIKIQKMERRMQAMQEEMALLKSQLASQKAETQELKLVTTQPRFAPRFQLAQYKLGEGITPFGEEGVRVSGFSVFDFHNGENTDSTFQLRNLNIYLDIPLEEKFLAFGEIEFEEGEGGDEVHTHLERMYLQWKLTDQAKLRFGRTISPYSTWNIIHADPLLPTTTKPLLVSSARMMSHMTGVELSGLVFPKEWEMQYYLGVGNGMTGGLNTDVNENKLFYGATYFRRSLKDMGELELGLSTMSGKDDMNYKENMLGVSAMYSLDRVKLWGEYYRSWIDAIDGAADFNADAFYIMLLYKLTDKLTGIVRYEENDQNSTVTTSNFNNGERWIWGLNYKPIPPVAFKLEYILHDEEGEGIGNNLVVGSVSVWF